MTDSKTNPRLTTTTPSSPDGKSNGRSNKRRLFSNKRSHAKAQGIPFDLTIDDVHFPTHCPVLGIRLDYEMGSKGAPTPQSPSFDRANSCLGYIPGNVIIVSNRANSIKHNASPEELRRVADFYARLENQ